MIYPALLTPLEFSAGTGGKIAASDPRLPAMLEGATSAIRNYCGWHVAPLVTEPMVLDGPGGQLLTLPTLRLAAVTSLSIAGEAVDLTDLEWSASGEVWRSCWPKRFRSVEITVSHGFDSAPDLVQVVQQVVANAITSPLGATREQAGPFAVSWATTAPGVSGGLSLLQRDLATLTLYRLPKLHR